MRFGLGFLGRTGSRKKLPPGQTFLRTAGVAIVAFIAPSYTLLTAAGSAVTGLIGGTGATASFSLSLYDLSDMRNLMVL